jgi:hypothetical protein
MHLKEHEMWKSVTQLDKKCPQENPSNKQFIFRPLA